MTWFRDYQQLFANAVAIYDGSLTSEGKLANIVNSSWNGTIISTLTTGYINKFGITKGIYGAGSGSGYIIPGTSDEINNIIAVLS